MADTAPVLAAPVALFGGTFDPVHLGHLKVALAAQQALGVADFRLLPAGDPPHREATFASAQQRHDMLKLALEAYPGLTIDERELQRDTPSWTVMTLQSLRQELPHSPLLLLMGQDAANHLDQWYRWREIFELASIVILSRPDKTPDYHSRLASQIGAGTVASTDQLLAVRNGAVFSLGVAAVEVSSTQVRERLAAGLSVRHMVPEKVTHYIAEHGLYQSC